MQRAHVLSVASPNGLYCDLGQKPVSPDCDSLAQTAELQLSVRQRLGFDFGKGRNDRVVNAERAVEPAV